MSLPNCIDKVTGILSRCIASISFGSVGFASIPASASPSDNERDPAAADSDLQEPDPEDHPLDKWGDEISTPELISKVIDDPVELMDRTVIFIGISGASGVGKSTLASNHW